MSAREFIDVGVSRGLRLSRGTADRAIRVAGPRVAGVVGELTSWLRRGRDRPTTETFTPSKPAVDGAVTPSPGTVAHNIAPKRPSAAPAAKTPPARKAGPGAKLPPRSRTT